MTKIHEFTYLSSDGKTQLHAMEWIPEDQTPKAVLQIAHGVSEYIARYDAFARYLNEQGFVVVGNDHLGHGGSEGETPVYFGEKDGWKHVVDDLYALHVRMQEQYPQLPFFIMGHSMGSFLTRSYLIRYPGTVKGAVVMGTGSQSPAIIAAGRLVARWEAGKRGRSAVSPLVNKMAFGSYNKGLTPQRTEFDWLSVDSGNVDRYVADPLCGKPGTVGLFLDMLDGFSFNQNPENLKKMDPATPVLFVSGACDPVGAGGKGVQKAYRSFLSAGVKDVRIKLYDGLRHEVLNEKEKDVVYRDISDWLESHL